MNEVAAAGMVKRQGVEVANVEDLKYLGSTLQRNGDCKGEKKKRIMAWGKSDRVSFITKGMI